MAIVGRQCQDRDTGTPRPPGKHGFLRAPRWEGPYTQQSELPAFGWMVPHDAKAWPINISSFGTV